MTIAAKYLKAGFHFWFRPDKILSGGSLITNPSKGFFDLGVCTALSPTFERTKIELKDTRGGVLKKVAEAITELKEDYKGTFADFNKKNLLLVFGAGEVSVNSRSAVDYTTEGENFGVSIQEGETLFLGTSSDNQAVGNVIVDTSFTPVVYARTAASTTQSTTYTLDTHYEFDALLGTVKIIDHPSSIDGIESLVQILVKYKNAAIAANNATYFIMSPQSYATVREGAFRIEIGSESNAERFIRTGRCALNVDTVNFTADDYSTYEMTFSVLNTDDAGRLFNIQ